MKELLPRLQYTNFNGFYREPNLGNKLLPDYKP